MDEGASTSVATFDPLNANSVYDTYVAPSSVYAAYEKLVLFSWKGLPTTLTRIFRNATRLPVDARILLSLYDAYLTFYVAAVCYEIDRLLLDPDLLASEAAKAFHRWASEYALNDLRFPDSLKPFVANVINLLASFADSNLTDPPEVVFRLVRARKRIVDAQLVWFGVTFDHSYKVTKKIRSVISNLSVCTTSNDDLFNGRASDLIANLCSVLPQLSLDQ